MAAFARYTKLFLFSLTGLLFLTILILWPFKYVKPSATVDKTLLYISISGCTCGILSVLFLLYETESDSDCEIPYQPLAIFSESSELEVDEGRDRKPINSTEFYGRDRKTINAAAFHGKAIYSPQFYGNIEIARIAFSSLRVFSPEESFKGSNDKTKDKCAICSEEFKIGELILPLSCKHKFHASCISSWSGNITCPICH